MLSELPGERGGAGWTAIGQPTCDKRLANRRCLDPTKREVVRPLGLCNRQRCDPGTAWRLCGQRGERRPSGYGAPRRRAILSKASPAASSIVPPRRAMAPSRSMRTSNVCPPETTSPIAGSVGASAPADSRSHAARRCPSRWFTGSTGRPRAHAQALPMPAPTRSDPTRPGPVVSATLQSRRQSRAPQPPAAPR